MKLSGRENIEFRKITIDKMKEILLLLEMKKIINDYEVMGHHCYELYTLMCSFAKKINSSYDVTLHNHLLVSYKNEKQRI